jgi:hypothetical protein
VAFLVKQWQMLIHVTQLPATLDREVTRLWRDAASGTIVRQERAAALMDTSPPAAGFYSPIDDVIYLPAGADATQAAVGDVARHETVHLLGSRLQARDAFAARFPGRWIDRWSAFEEGTAELLSREASPTGQSQQPDAGEVVDRTTTRRGRATTTVEMIQGGPMYEHEVGIMRAIIAALGRTVVLQAYFTGRIPEALFAELERRVP